MTFNEAEYLRVILKFWIFTHCEFFNLRAIHVFFLCRVGFLDLLQLNCKLALIHIKKHTVYMHFSMEKMNFTSLFS